MSATPGLKEIRAYVRGEAAKAKAWEVLDAKIGDLFELDRAIAERQAAAEQLATALETQAAERDRIAAANEATVAQAKAQAQEIIDNARQVEADAERRAAQADQIVADAREKADRIVDQGRVEGNRLANELDGQLTDMRAEIAVVEQRKTQLGNDCAALEKRKAGLQAEIRKLIAGASEAVA